MMKTVRFQDPLAPDAVTQLQRLALVSQDPVNKFLADPRVPYDVQDGQPLVMRTWSLTQAFSMGVQYICPADLKTWTSAGLSPD